MNSFNKKYAIEAYNNDSTSVVIDMTEEDVIVEFGNNKNCRIPMRKQAIAEVEKAEQASA